MTSRFDGGTVWFPDASQIELRVPAVRSGDPILLRELRDNVDLHWGAAHVILEEIDPLEKSWPWRTWSRKDAKNDRHPAYKFRQAGKQTNFLVCYKGQAAKLQKTYAEMYNLIVPLPVCERIVARQRKRYEVMVTWQSFIIAEAMRLGYTTLPCLGTTRHWLGSPAQIEATYSSEIVNYGIQPYAAAIVLDGMSEAQKYREEHHLQHLLHFPFQIYDAVKIDSHPSVAERVPSIVEECFGPARNSFLRRFLAHHGHDLPFPMEPKKFRIRSTRLLKGNTCSIRSSPSATFVKNDQPSNNAANATSQSANAA
jgi:hypothetical protein